jgi:hypothetical protein
MTQHYYGTYFLPCTTNMDCPAIWKFLCTPLPGPWKSYSRKASCGMRQTSTRTRPYGAWRCAVVVMSRHARPSAVSCWLLRRERFPMPISFYPILTFEECKLSPSLGYLFKRQWLDPLESVVCILWKFARMNRLPGHQVVANVARRQIDPYEGCAATAAELDIRLTAASLGLAQKTIRFALQRPELRRAWCSELRFCPRCMSRGYHSVVHQFGGVSHYPVHGCCLQTRCRSCGTSSEYLIKASVLDAPFKCPDCQRHYGNDASSFVNRIPMQARDRSAIVRAFIG